MNITKKISAITLGVLLTGFITLPTIAQEAEILTEEFTEDPLNESAPAYELPIRRLEPVIQGPDAAPANEPVSFDGSASSLLSPSEGNPNYTWDFDDDMGIKYGEAINHTFTQTGVYDIKLELKQGTSTTKITKKRVTIYDTQAVIFTSSYSNIRQLRYEAGKNGVHLHQIKYPQSGTGFSAEEQFLQILNDNHQLLDEVDMIIFDAKAPDALSGLIQWWGTTTEENHFETTEKTWVQLTPGAIEQAATQANTAFQVMRPDSIIVTRHEALSTLWQNKSDAGSFIQQLSDRAIEFRVVDQRFRTSRLLPLSSLVTYLVTNGISQNVIYLLLAAPFIAFVIAFSRQFIGLKTFGVFTPLLLALSFIILGLKFGMLAFLVVLLVSYMIRVVFMRVELLYIPKVSLTLSLLSLSFFFVIWLGVLFDTSINLSLTIFPMLVMVTVSEKFLSAQSTEGLKQSFLIVAETVIVSLLAYGLVTWMPLQKQILILPELVLLPIFGNVWLGRFTGLRISEYLKFRAFFIEENTE